MTRRAIILRPRGARVTKSSGNARSALITGYGMNPPSAHSEPNFIVWQRSRSSSRISLDRLLAGDDAVDHLHAAHRADAARRTLAAGLRGAELHREARLVAMSDGVVEHHHAAMADQSIARGERLVVERRVEQGRREIGAERPADLHRAHRPAGQRAAADIVHQFAQRDAEAAFEQPAISDVAGEAGSASCRANGPCRSRDRTPRRAPG